LIARLPVQVSQLDKVLDAYSHKFCVCRDLRRKCKVRSNNSENAVTIHIYQGE
jgi:hypothetical protein